MYTYTIYIYIYVCKVVFPKLLCRDAPDGPGLEALPLSTPPATAAVDGVDDGVTGTDPDIEAYLQVRLSHLADSVCDTWPPCCIIVVIEGL